MDLYIVLLVLTTIVLLIWTTIVGVIPPLVAVIISYYVAKYTSAPILAEAKRIERHVYKAAKAIGVGKDIVKSLSSAKGGRATPDPIGSWLSEKTGGLSDFFKAPTSRSKDPDRVHDIIAEEGAKRGLVFRKKGSDTPDLTPVHAQ